MRQVKRPRLYARLPPVAANSDICRLSVSDHYAMVYMCDGGSYRLLMRFSDAVKEMDDEEGFLTHRSHWVALREIKRGYRDGTREFVELNAGSHVPVSKTYRENLVAAGYL